MALLTSEGFTCAGRDPAYLSDAPRDSADVVNLGYVINVVEDSAGRLGTVYADAQCESTCGNNGFVKRPRATLKQSWNLARRLLVVSAQVLRSGRGKTPVEFGDGVLTGRGTL